MTDSKKYHYLPINDCLERISECFDIKKVIKVYIKDNVGNEDAWESNLMTLLTEYYAITSRYVELMSELILTPPSISEELNEEIITVDAHKYAILTSYSKLMIVNEMELKHSHRVHLFIQ
jgi:hypothetical protein